MLIKEHQSILIPVDFSKQSFVAVKQSYNLARFTDARLVLLHVSESSITDHKNELEELAQKTRQESGLKVETLSLKGDVYELTDQVAEELKSSLIIIGLDSHVRFRKFLGINNVSRFIKKAPCPVITIRAHENRKGCKNIIIPLDLNPDSREKVPIAVQLANYYKADIKVVSVFHPDDHKYENDLLPYIYQVKKFIKQRGVNCTNKSIASEHIAESIVEYANQNDGDLIVQMNKTSMSFGEMISGVWSEKLVDISNIPVLSINPMIKESNASFGAVGG